MTLDPRLRRLAVPVLIVAPLLYIAVYWSGLYISDDRLVTQFLDKTSSNGRAYSGATFDGPAFWIPHHIPARIDKYLAPVTPVKHAYDADLIVGPEGGLPEIGPLIPRTIFQTWKTNVVGPRAMAALSSWQEMNPE